MPPVGEPVVALRYAVLGDDFWLFTLTESALYAAWVGGIL